MSCFINSGASLDCSDSVGGIKTVYILGGTTPSIDELTVDGDGAITLIEGVGTLYQFELKRNTSSLTQNLVKSYENGTVYFEQVLEMVLYKYDVDKRNQVRLLAQNDNLKVIAVDQNDVQYYLGEVRGMYLSAGEIASGLALGDRNGFTLTFTAEEPEMARVVIGVLEPVADGGILDGIALS